MSRISGAIVLVLAALLAPWWLFLGAGALGVARFHAFVEFAFLSFLYDLALGPAHFSPRSFVMTLAALVLLVASELIRHHTRMQFAR